MCGVYYIYAYVTLWLGVCVIHHDWHCVFMCVFVAGPCGGKTTGQSRLCTFFENLGWKVGIYTDINGRGVCVWSSLSVRQSPPCMESSNHGHIFLHSWNMRLVAPFPMTLSMTLVSCVHCWETLKYVETLVVGQWTQILGFILGCLYWCILKLLYKINTFSFWW